MAVVRVSFNVHGAQQVSRAFESYGLDVRDMRIPLQRAGEQIQHYVALAFDTEGGTTGSPWAALAPAYAQWKALHYPGKPILQRTGRMKRSLLAKNALRVTKQRLVYEPTNLYAGYHQTGTTRMPARPPVLLTEAHKRQAIDRSFAVWLNDLRKEHGL